jgi:hypothetical protein
MSENSAFLDVTAVARLAEGPVGPMAGARKRSLLGLNGAPDNPQRWLAAARHRPDASIAHLARVVRMRLPLRPHAPRCTRCTCSSA